MNSDSARGDVSLTSPPTVGTVQRRQDIELVRLICAAGIVFYHSTKSGNAVYYSALIVFLTLSIMLAGRSSEFGWLNIKRRATRLLMPWLVWFAIYALFNVVRNREPFPTDDGIVAGVLAGSSLHLWFMPFIFICLVSVDFLRTRIAGATLCRVSALIGVAIILTSPYWRSASEELVLPLPQWIHASVAVLIGVVLLNASSVSRAELLLLLAGVFGALLFVLQEEMYAVPYIIGGCVCLFIFSGIASGLKLAHVSMLTNTALGIYFIHMFVLKGLVKTPVGSTLYLPISVFAISFFLVVVGRMAFPRLAKYWS